MNMTNRGLVGRSGPMVPRGLRCDYRGNPLGVCRGAISFAWRVEAPGQHRRQSAYQLRVARRAMDLEPGNALVWDSGRVRSSTTIGIAYDGPPLASRAEYSWAVRVWDESGLMTAWSEPATFETELDPERDWRALWISRGPREVPFQPPSGEGPVDAVRAALGPATYLRRSFVLERPPVRARLYITARGLYEARLNGSRAGDVLLAPGWTDYAKRCQYQTFAVEDLLTEGENVIGALLGDGWYSGFYGYNAKRAGAHYGRLPHLLAQLVVSVEDGTDVWVLTDRQWKATTGAVTYSDLIMGESWDGRLEPRGWDAPGFRDESWTPVSTYPRGDEMLVPDPGPPVRASEELAPRHADSRPDGRTIVDFGQNLGGWARLSLRGTAGVRIRLRHGEALAADGSLYVDNLRTARQTDEFITTGGDEVLEPHFTTHGFRYVEVSGYRGELSRGALVARVVHSDILRTGCFECSDPSINRLFENIDWSQRANFVSVPTDCPQRDERLGWLGDAQIFARTASYNRDVASFFRKWLDDVTDAQSLSGAYPDVAPNIASLDEGAPAWSDAGVIIPWTLLKMYGDTSVVSKQLPSLTKWMDFLEMNNSGFLRSQRLGMNYGDWLAPMGDATPRELLATAYWAYDAALMEEMCRAVGHHADAERYQALRAAIISSFNGTFVQSDGRLTSGTQTAYALALHMRLLPGELRPLAARHLVRAIEREDWHLATGFVGVGYLLPVLCEAGYTDVAYRILEQRSFPSWLYAIDRGATTIWERWDGWTEDRGFQSPYMNSFNHYSLGSVGEWLYRFVLGIDQEVSSYGFEKTLIQPHPGGSLRFAKGSYSSVRGLISVAWQLERAQLSVSVDVPANTVATICLPTTDPTSFSAGGLQPDHVTAFPGDPSKEQLVFRVGSGSYELVSAFSERR